MTKTKTDIAGLSQHDLDVLRKLAKEKVALAHNPVNEERRRAWYALDAGVGDRVMVLTEPWDVRDAKRPLAGDTLVCTDDWARGLEQAMRSEARLFRELQDDHVIEPVWNVNWLVGQGDYGVAAVVHEGGDATHMGARRWDPPIQDLDKDFDKLRPRTFTVDRAGTMAAKARLEAVFEGILSVRIRGSYYWTMGMTWRAIELIGLEQLMMAMYDNPTGLHRLMAFLRDDHLAFSSWLEKDGLYSLNNENDYVGSGSTAYTRALPWTGWQVGSPVRRQDLWVLLESQETVGVGPELFEEFIFPYQLSIAEQFGRCYYGCCEPVNNRWHILKRLPNLARVSVSPWADQAFMANAVGRDVVFSRKPNPTLISTARFDEEAIRADIRQTLDIARGCRLELIMKDVHTLNNEPGRIARWVQLAREEIAKR